MSNSIQRLRFFDGEYLRSYDFTDEQSYHVSMRRLLNHRLHLHGIAYGLEIVVDAMSTPTATFCSIAPGMAIDKIGREIIVAAPYSLTSVLTGPGLSAGDYEVWICFQESETGLPAAGYLDCSQKDQQTRWQESFQVLLKPTSGPSTVMDCGGVRLGIITLSNSSLGLQIVPPPKNVERTYVGIRAQRIIAPDQETDQFDITKQNKFSDLPGYLEVNPSVFGHGNLITRKNAVIGADFPLPSTDPNLPKSIPPTGNLKITNDLFLNGDFYGFISGQWYGLKQYIQSLMPYIAIGGPIPIPIPIQTSNTTTGVNTPTLTVTCPLPTVNQTQVLLSITDFELPDVHDFPQWSTLGGISLKVWSPGLTPAGPPQTYNLPINWTVAPAYPIPPLLTTYQLPVSSITVSYIAVFFP